MDHYNHPPQPMARATKYAIFAALAVFFLAYIGNFHFVHGSDIALRKIPKISWSLSETYINSDELKATPVLMLRAKYPLFTALAIAKTD